MMPRIITPQVMDAETTLKLNLDGIKLVEASAGTGKTYAIGNLYLRMLLDGYAIGEILVVTFTNAATEELRGRIRARIYEALGCLNGSDCNDAFLALWIKSLSDDHREDAAKRLGLALTSMDAAAIYTIHGFCQRSLIEHAFNSSQAFDMEMLTDDRQLWRAALKDWWRNQTYGLDQAELAQFMQALGSLDALIHWQEPLRKPGVVLVPEQTGDQDKQLSETRCLWHGLVQQWQQEKDAIEDVLAHSPALSRSKTNYGTDILQRILSDCDAYFTAESWQAMPDSFAMLGRDALAKGSKPAKRGSDPQLASGFFVRCQQLYEAVINMRVLLRVELLHAAHAFAVEKVTRMKQQSGQMAFDDQLLLLDQALADSDALAVALHKQFPIAMIDEFQDTDALQYRIFSRIYRRASLNLNDPNSDGLNANDADRGGLIMIGDPKQAIYSFRGGDIFTYIKAKQDAAEHYTLKTNWRSTPQMVAVVNRLFSHRDDPFIYPEIPFEPVDAQTEREHKPLCRHGVEVAPFTIWPLPGTDQGKPMSKTALMPWVHAQTANEIVRLLEGGQRGTTTLGTQAVRAGDIAVLVRNHDEATAIRAALAERGVAAVAGGKKHVFESDEAAGLQRLLAAIIDYRNKSILRQGLASSLLHLDYQSMYSAIHDEDQWFIQVENFKLLHETWHSRGFMAMFQLMMTRLHIGENLIRAGEYERRLTNVWHLGELLQQATQSITGMDALLSWFRQQIAEENHAGAGVNASLDAELRLESDGDLVQIVTTHKSKGLQYPIVFLPYMWTCAPKQSGDGLLGFYDMQKACRCMDALGEPSHLLAAEKERLAEDVRLAYVAITRARTKVYLVWGAASFKWFKGYYSSSVTALAWLLHPRQQVKDLADHLPGAYSGNADLRAELAQLSEDSHALLEIPDMEAEVPEVLRLTPADAHGHDAVLAEFPGTVAADWRISSFSSLTRDVHQAFKPAERVQSDDPVFAFPAGSQTGLFLHALLEKMDFQSDIRAYVADFTRCNASRYGLNADDHLSTLQRWMADVLATAIHANGMKLADIAKPQRLHELAFDFCIGRLNIKRLNQLLNEAAGSILQPLSVEDCRGYITGIIDLVFEHDGCYFLADYKSNQLGFSLDAYAPQPLRQTMLERRYDLQYLIYILALHRYLKLRIPDYDYGRHIGGVCYLFLRGMRAEYGCHYGVFTHKPDFALIDKLDRECFKQG